MAEPISFDQCNAVLGPPKGKSEEEVQSLSICRTFRSDTKEPLIVTCWKVSKEELDEITRTGRVWVLIHDITMAPILVLGTDPFEVRG